MEEEVKEMTHTGDESDRDCCLIQLSNESSRYEDVAKQFYHSRDGCPISPIGRIFQLYNPALLSRCRQKHREMAGEIEGGKVTQRFLFHGTPMRNVDSIAREGFRLPDRPHCLGKSVCLAACSWQSDPYTSRTVNFHQYPEMAGPPVTPQLIQILQMAPNPPTCSRHYTFVCRALVGSPAPPHHDCRQSLPPGCHHLLGQGSHRLQWGIFDVDQIFPMFLIEWWMTRPVKV
ncbi:hypothetical protein ACOMHN_064015 [Nucella lapillus]